MNVIIELWLSHDIICLFNYLLRNLCWQWTIFSENVSAMTFFAVDFRKISSASHFLSILFPQIIIFSKQWIVSGLSHWENCFLAFSWCTFFGTILDRIWNSLLGGFDKENFDSILVTKLFLFHSQHLCSRQVHFFLDVNCRKRNNREMPLTTQFTTTKILSFAFFFSKSGKVFPTIECSQKLSWMF